MHYWTYGQAKEKIERDLDLQQETFITPDEMKGYFNAAIDEAEAEIHTIYEDYFLSKKTFSLTAGLADYELPEDIYALKIRSIIYKDGNDIYAVRRLPEKDKFYTILADNESASETARLRYLIYNPSGLVFPKIHLVPEPLITKANCMHIWYLRNANRVDLDTDLIDIPEFIQFVLQFVKVRCYEKEGHPNLSFAVQALEQQRKLMVDTLSKMVPDNDNEIEKDFTHYVETV